MNQTSGAVRPVIGIPWSEENESFFEDINTGTSFLLTMNTGAVLRFNGSTWASALTPAEWQSLWDYESAYGVRQIVKSRKGRCTLVISSHNLQELEEICEAYLDKRLKPADRPMALAR